MNDPNFEKRDKLDPALADAWRSVRLKNLLQPSTCAIAARLGYELGAEQTFDAGPIAGFDLETGVL